MNSVFLLIAGIMVLVAFAFVLPPLWRQRPVIAADLDERNILIARQRLAELKESRQSGVLSQAQYDEQLAELEQALSDDLDIESHVTTPASQGRWMVYVLVAAIPLLAGSLYAPLGTSQGVNPQAEIAAANPGTPSLEDIKKMVAKLAERMKANPGDLQGWIMLGKSYKYLQQYPQAAEALEQAYKLAGDRVDVLLQYADALAYANNEQLAGKPAELVFKALTLEPDNVTGLWLAGMAKAQAGESAAAIKLWRRLDKLLAPGSQEQQEVQGLLAKLERETPGVPADEPPLQAAKTADIAIAVNVSLAPELQKSVSPGDTVFVYAQALSGPKMPLAIVKKQVSDLPLTVSLNDAMAMMPNMKLSNFANVKLLARVSKSGNAMTHPGDLIGVIESVALADKNSHTIVINGAVK